MIAGKMVKVRFKKYFVEQRLWVFVGKVLHFSENWLMVEGKGIISYKGIEPAHVDENPRTAAALGIQGIPALKLFKGGRAVDEMVGAAPKAHILRFLQPYLS